MSYVNPFNYSDLRCPRCQRNVEIRCRGTGDGSRRDIVELHHVGGPTVMVMLNDTMHIPRHERNAYIGSMMHRGLRQLSDDAHALGQYIPSNPWIYCDESSKWIDSENQQLSTTSNNKTHAEKDALIKRLKLSLKRMKAKNRSPKSTAKPGVRRLILT